MWQARRRTRAALETVRVDGWLGTTSLIDGVEIVRLPTDEPLAYAVCGAPPQVVISDGLAATLRSEEHTSELQSLMRISYAVFCLKKKKKNNQTTTICQRTQ